MFVVSIRLPLDLWQELGRKIEEHKFPSISEALRSYTILGMKIESFKHEISNPDFMKTIDELKQGNALFEWFATLQVEQIEAISLAAQMEKENRFKQEQLT